MECGIFVANFAFQPLLNRNQNWNRYKHGWFSRTRVKNTLWGAQRTHSFVRLLGFYISLKASNYNYFIDKNRERKNESALRCCHTFGRQSIKINDDVMTAIEKYLHDIDLVQFSWVCLYIFFSLSLAPSTLVECLFLFIFFFVLCADFLSLLSAAVDRVMFLFDISCFNFHHDQRKYRVKWHTEPSVGK